MDKKIFEKGSLSAFIIERSNREMQKIYTHFERGKSEEEKGSEREMTKQRK